MYYTSEQSP